MDLNQQEEMGKLLKEAKNIATTCPNKAYTMSKEVYDIAKENNFKLEEGYALINMSLVCRAKSENNKMLEHSYQALEIFEALQEPIGQVRALNLIGTAYFYNSVYERAFRYFTQALDILEKYKDDFLLSCILNNIGEVFRETLKYEVALEYYSRALNIGTEAVSKINTASVLGNIGEIYYLLDNKKEALEYFTKSYEILVEEDDVIILGDIENKLGKVYYINQDYSKASEFFTSALTRLGSINHKFYAIDVLMNIAKLQFEIDGTTPYYYYKKAVNYAEETNAKKKLSTVYKTISDYYETIGDFEDALEYFKKHHRVEKEITASMVGNKFEMLKIELEHSNKINKLKETEMINERLEMEISNQRNELAKIQKLNEVLEEKAFEDELTRIPNRRYLNYHLNKIWESSESQDQVIALFIIDIDNFKKYNDCWGHCEGDKCIQRVANCLKEIQLMQNDVFGRYGGEEFIYYALNINYDQALELGNLFRTKVEKLSLSYMLDSKSSVLTISVGGVFGKLSSFHNISQMIQNADKELYKAKDMGRNITLIDCV